MSIKLMSIVWELELPPGEKLVLLALADQANDSGTHCYPSVGTIAKRSGQNERTVRRSLRSLESKGHLSSNERRGTSTDYLVHPGHHAPPDKSPPRTKTTKTPDTTPPKPYETPISSEAKASSEKRVREPKPQIEIPDWVPRDKLDHWLASRKAKVTPHVIELAVGELEKLRRDGHDPGKVLDQSTLRGWTGLFPIKDQQNGRLQADRGNSGKPRGGSVDGFTEALRQVRNGQPDEYPAGDDDGGTMRPAERIGYQPH